MNYERALTTLNHARTGKPLPKKKLMNATWLHRVMQHESGVHLVSLSLFDKSILTWFPNGDIALDNKGFWSWSTKDRLNKYMPSGFQVWQVSPFWFIQTPSGVLPYRNGMHLDARGVDEALPAEMSFDSATNLQGRIHKYALFYANRLVNGVISKNREVDCGVCSSVSDINRDFMTHIYDHVKYETTPAALAEQAVHMSPKVLPLPLMRDVLHASWHENQIIWRKPKSKKAMIARTEALMTSENPPRLDIVPRQYVTQLTTVIENFLLVVLGFQRMGDS